MSKFDWNDLQAFLAMARTGRLVVAAKQLGVDHSTLSRRIAGLEAALGVPLFERRPAGFILTPEGERVVADAEKIEATAIRIRARIDDATEGLSGVVRIGTPEGFGTYFLAPRIASLGVAHPELHLELVANPRAFSLSKREADLAVSMNRPAQGRVYANKIVDYSLGLYASQEYCDTHEAIRSRDDLPKHRWIGYVEDLVWTEELNYLPQVSAANLNPRIRISNVISQMRALVGHAGVGVLPDFMARNEKGLVRILPGEVRLVRSYWLIAHADTRDLARIRAVSDFIHKSAQQTDDDFWLS